MTSNQMEKLNNKEDSSNGTNCLHGIPKGQCHYCNQRKLEEAKHKKQEIENA